MGLYTVLGCPQFVSRSCLWVEPRITIICLSLSIEIRSLYDPKPLIDGAVLQMTMVSCETVFSSSASTKVLLTSTWQMPMATRFLFSVSSWRF